MKNKKKAVEIDPASKASERGKLHPALPVKGATQAPLIERHHIIVTGNVQGVGYRKFAVDHALQLNLTGFCKNLLSGEVEIEAEGPPENIRQLIEHLHEGPPRGEVEKVTVASISLQHDTEFTIRY